MKTERRGEVKTSTETERGGEAKMGRKAQAEGQAQAGRNEKNWKIFLVFCLFFHNALHKRNRKNRKYRKKLFKDKKGNYKD